MKLELSSVGNPDFGQNPNEPLWGCEPNMIVKVSSFEEASKLCKSYIKRNNLGGGNWSGGNIYDDNGTFIAYVSYNGRVWEVDENGNYWGNKEIILENSK